MAATSSSDGVVDTQGLRERNVPQHTEDQEGARETVQGLNALEERSEKAEADKKTFGRTPRGDSKLILSTCVLEWARCVLVFECWIMVWRGEGVLSRLCCVSMGVLVGVGNTFNEHGAHAN